MIRVAIKGLTARPLRTLLTAIAIVLGVAMVSGAFTVTDTMRNAADELSASAYDRTDAVVAAPVGFKDDEAIGANQTIPASTVSQVRAVPGVGVAVGDILDEAKIVGSDGKTVGQGPYFGVGFDSRAPGARTVSPFQLTSGRWATGPGEVVIDGGVAEKEHKHVGDTIPIVANGPTRRFRIVGVSTFGNVSTIGTASTAVFDLRVAQELFGKQGRIDEVLVAAKDGTAPAALRLDLGRRLAGSGLQVQTARAQDRFTLDGLKQFVSFIRVFLLAFGGIAVLVGAFTIFNSLSITVAQRSRELALLRTMGASRRQVMGSVMFESLLLGALASAIGLAAGLGLAKGLNALFTALGMDLPRTGTVFATHTIVAGAAVGVLATLAAGVVPALRATRVAPVSAMRGDGPTAAAKARTSRVGIGLTAVGLAVLAYGMFAGGLSATNRLVSLVPGCLGLFAGVAALSPRFVAPLASVIGRPGQRIGRSAGMLARRNAMRNPGRTASTAAALMIGIALVTFVSVLGSGLKDTTTGSVHKSVKAQYVVAGADGWSPIATRIPAQVAAVPGVTSVTSVVQDQAKVGADKVAVSGVDTATIAKGFRFDWKQGDDAVASSLGRDGAIVLDDFAKDRKLAIGDRFSVRSRSGKHLSLVVRGTVKSSFFNPLGMGQLTVSDATFRSAFTTRKPRMTLVSGTAEAKAGLEKALAAYPDVKVKTAERFGDDAAAQVDQMLAIFYVLLALAIIVSLFGIVNTLVLSVMERTRELGMLRAVGMSRRQVRRMVRHEGIITAQIGAVLGIVVGLVIGGLVTGALSSSTGMGFSVPVGSLVAFSVVAALAGVAAAVLPARRASRLNVLDALSYE